MLKVESITIMLQDFYLFNTTRVLYLYIYAKKDYCPYHPPLRSSSTYLLIIDYFQDNLYLYYPFINIGA